MSASLPRMLPLWAAIPVAAAAGVLLSTAFPGLGWWLSAFPATAAILWSLVGRSVWGSALVGLVAGWAFYGTHVVWLTTYLGPIPWIALVSLQALFFAVGAVLMSLVWRFFLLAPRSLILRGVVLPLCLAAVWTLRESVAAVWPYGGFSWGRLAFSQSESPLGPLAAWVGTTGLSFAIAAVAAVIVQTLREKTLLAPRRALVFGLAIVAVVAPPAWIPVVDGSVRVAGVQGNSLAGLHDRRAPGDILDDHLQATVPVLDQDVDLIVWPENAADLNPLAHDRAARVFDLVTDRADAPLLAGTITSSGDRRFNSALLWEPGVGVTGQYDKAHPVPFAEYLPDRDFWYPLAPDLFDLIPRDLSIGQRPNVLQVLPEVRAGVAICFDIVDDGLLREMTSAGANIIVAPTNNADFGHSDESVQQLAIARVRAIEFGRSVVNVSTVGTSAVIAPDGTTMDRLPTFVPGVMVEDVPLVSTDTPAARFGSAIHWGIVAAGLCAALGSAAGLGMMRRAKQTGRAATSR